MGDTFLMDAQKKNQLVNGGRRGIRTLDTVQRGITVFETAAFNRSAILPTVVRIKIYISEVSR